MLSTERIEIVILMAKLESTAAVCRALQRRGVKVPSENTIRDTFKKFKETGSIHNRPKSGRAMLEDEDEKKCFQQCDFSTRWSASALPSKSTRIFG